MVKTTSVTIGICAYNEEQNIGRLLDAIITDQRLPKSVTLSEILIVASGCTDRTIPIVKATAKTDDRIRLFIERKRRGKVTAVNKILRQAHGDLIILQSADTLPAEHAYARLLKPLLTNKRIGMTGGRPIPVDDPNSFMGFVNHLQWELHHTLSLKHPKCGEMVAFRNLPIHIPSDNVHDEAYIEMFFRSRNYTIMYVPDAIVVNKGPATATEFIRRRRNITAGFVQLWERYNFKPGTAVTVRQALSFIWMMVKKHPLKTHWIIAAAAMQHYAATLGSRDWEKGMTDAHVWEVTESSKNVKVQMSNGKTTSQILNLKDF